ncbi:MAG: YidC/Oxa1 family membrane protein insertase [Clostridia bacterium]
MGAIANLFGYLLNFLYNLFNNYGIAIIVFTILLRIILIPITVSQQKSMKKNAKVQEKMKEIQKKYKNNPEKLNQETIELYKREKVSPFSGCLSSIIQIILIISVFWLVSKPLTYMKKVDSNKVNEYIEQIKTEEGKTSAYPEIQVIQTKSAEDSEVAINMDFLGLDLSKVPNQNLKDITVYIIPVLYVITSFVSIKMTNNMQDKAKEKKKADKEKKAAENKENDEEKALISEEEAKSEEAMEAMQDMTKSMNYMIPIMSITIAFIAPLGLALYWLVSNIAMIIERIIINKISENKKEEEENA